MALQYVTLEKAALAFGVHPRTILRAITGNYNIYWTEDINQELCSIEDIANAYSTTTQTLRAIFEGRDKVLRPDQAASVVGVRPRTFRERVRAGRYKKIGKGGVTRYLHSKLIEDAIANTKE